jgi:hypothetical protein
MPTPKERLSHLLELAAQGVAERAALAGEVADLLLDWPAEYPATTRATFAALLEKIVREMDEAAQAALSPRLEGRNDFPLSLLNELFLAAPDGMKDALLARNNAVMAVRRQTVNSDALLEAARNTVRFAPALSRALSIPLPLVTRILADRSGRALAAVCRGAGINRASFSAIMILAGPVRAVHQNFAMLSVYDRVPENGAANLIAYWQSRGDQPAIIRAA